MSRIGRKPIEVPAGVDVTIGAGNEITTKGPLGTLNMTMHTDMVIKKDGNVITVERPSENKMHKSLHGLTRTLVSNMVEGVSAGYKKELEINGVGYRAALQGSTLVLNLGYSHPVEMEAPEGIKIEVPSNTQIIISGINKQMVGEFAAKVREKRPPEPYKGKGIKYTTERIRRKEGKAGAKK
ncbi:MAG: 50S ribosomal protein L6 [Oscillospiraceae bacterium]|nr:50S ribosomal protein L6 [Oscillospiraceae bacterium]